MLVRLFLFFCLAFFAAKSTAVVIDGKDWMQVSLTTGYTYNDAAAQCDVLTGLCSGLITRGGNSLDVNGYTWANNADMASLFGFITGQSASLFNGPTANGNPNFSAATPAPWAESFIDIDGAGADTGFFDVTLNIGVDNYGVFGLTRTTFVDGNNNVESDRSYVRVSPNASSIIIGNPHGFDTSRSHTGLWFYKSVPAPGPLGLLAVGLIVLLRLKQ